MLRNSHLSVHSDWLMGILGAGPLQNRHNKRFPNRKGNYLIPEMERLTGEKILQESLVIYRKQKPKASLAPAKPLRNEEKPTVWQVNPPRPP